MDEERRKQLGESLIEKGKEMIALCGDILDDGTQAHVTVWNDHISVGVATPVRREDGMVDFDQRLSCWADPKNDQMGIIWG